MTTDVELLQKFPRVIVADADRVVLLNRETGPYCRWNLAWWLDQRSFNKTKAEAILAHPRGLPTCRQKCKVYVRGLGEQSCLWWSSKCMRSKRARSATIER